MHSNGNGPSLDELRAMARRDGRRRWYVTMHGERQVIDPDDFELDYAVNGRQRSVIELVAWPEGWRYRGRR